MGKYGVRSNFIAPRARTRMTMSMPNHAMFDEPESGFDTMHPAWPAELVAFLASEHVDFNGQGFIVWGGQVVLVQGSTKNNGPLQGEIIEKPDGKEWWFVHYQESDPYGRIVHLQPVRWHDGWRLM